MAKYDYLIVGAGLSGAVFAQHMTANGKRCLVIDRRRHIGGNCYTHEVEGVMVHKYGAHIFRTNDRVIWDYVRRFAEFNNFVNSPVASYCGEMYNLPFNMNTFRQLWGIATPIQAQRMIEMQRIPCDHPDNLEEYALSVVGRDVYEKLIQKYTEKQWGRSCRDLPASTMRRIPIRYTYDNNYYDALYQGVPVDGYTDMIDNMLIGSDVKLDIDYKLSKEYLNELADTIVYTGAIDELFSYARGVLQYRSLRFEHEVIDQENVQGVAVVNHTGDNVPYTRTIEHKHFVFGKQKKSVLTTEYPETWVLGKERYYPVNDMLNQYVYQQYLDLMPDGMVNGKRILLLGRLAEYKYYDMQDAIHSAMMLADRELSKG